MAWRDGTIGGSKASFYAELSHAESPLGNICSTTTNGYLHHVVLCGLLMTWSVSPPEPSSRNERNPTPPNDRSCQSVQQKLDHGVFPEKVITCRNTA